MPEVIDPSFAFYEQLVFFCRHNRRKIRSRYNGLTRKFLAYNDFDENPTAFLRRPQFEALEMYVFIKEFLGNQQVFQMFEEWRSHTGNFDGASYYAVDKSGQGALFDSMTEKTMDIVFAQMKRYKEDYPNYIYALTMGLGKTILMATCIFYEFLLARQFPKDKRFCHNALVFAPDRTVLESLREIMTFDKTRVVPPEYARLLDANIKFHFLEETGTSLQTLDDSDFNIVISNTQKIIVKRKRKADTPAQVLFGADSVLAQVYGTGGDDEDEDVFDDASLMDNQRFKKLCRLRQLGVYVDEAHHLFGADLEKQIRSAGGQKTSLRDTINLLAASTSIVACYNFTGTPYVNRQLLPEVVYAYSLRDSIRQRYLKDADLMAFENVKSEDFLRAVITRFWDRYGGHLYEDLPPKLAIFASTIEEADQEIRPAVERILADLGIPLSSILINVGDEKLTKDQDIRDFNNLDQPGTQGSQKQFLILVGKGREGWNCRSLFGVALFRSPKSKIFVLQATMRCLRQITDDQQTASVFLSKENYDTLDAELSKNFNMEIAELSNKQSERRRYEVRVLPPPRTITLKRVWHEYILVERTDPGPIDLGLADADLSRYAATIYEQKSIGSAAKVTETSGDELRQQTRYSLYTLTAEVARYLNLSPVRVSHLLADSIDGPGLVLDTVNQYNGVLHDIVIPGIFDALFEVTSEVKSEDRELVLLREPKDRGFYDFSARPELVVKQSDERVENVRWKSFHADTYCFDSQPERECFFQYIRSPQVKEVYFTGMFTSNQGDFLIQYYDPESGRIRSYYPDFLARMADDTYEVIEVKGDDQIDSALVKAKTDAATEMATASGVEYKMYAGSRIMKSATLAELVAASGQDLQPVLRIPLTVTESSAK
ncbi:MAG: DEAD/DEAH box helicase family protein [Propionibacteriaceae bacterium]|nr:DEAD/DEAH box helicase family protein [Propionibacteriaceae bacterium]